MTGGIYWRRRLGRRTFVTVSRTGPRLGLRAGRLVLTAGAGGLRLFVRLAAGFVGWLR